MSDVSVKTTHNGWYLLGWCLDYSEWREIGVFVFIHHVEYIFLVRCVTEWRLKTVVCTFLVKGYNPNSTTN